MIMCSENKYYKIMDEKNTEDFIKEYHKLAKKVVAWQQKQPFSIEEARRQTELINGVRNTNADNQSNQEEED